jgi:hypothetical protein
MASERYSIRLQVTGDFNDSWKCTWQDPQWPDKQYHVDASVLQEAASAVRDALQQVIAAAGVKAPLGPPMKTLASKGAELQDAIFLGRGAGINNAVYVRDKHLPSRDDWMLLVSTDQRVYIPWGLAYAGDPSKLPDNPPAITPDLYAGFWCLRYGVSTLHDIIDPSGVTTPRANDEVQMLTIVNQECWDAAEKVIPDTERELFKSSLARSAPLISSSQEFFKAWKKGHRDIDLLYLYCHANGSKLALTDTDEIAVNKFRLEIRHDPPQTHPVCLVFLNGCQTAIGASKGGFMEATAALGFCGFVGTEAKVPDLFAMRFAADFFGHLLYDEMTVFEIMDKLRREHWPLGLVYSACCHPLFKIRRIDSAPAARPSRNLCDFQLTATKSL